MSSKFFAATALAVALIGAPPAFASTTIDFETTDTGGAPVNGSAVTATDYDAQGVTFTGAFFRACNTSACAASPGNFYISSNNFFNPFSVSFGSAVNNFTFASALFPLSSTARAFDGAGNLLGTINTSSPLNTFAFNFGGIRSVSFTGFQQGVDNFAFDITPTLGGVPEPMTWALMIVGFGVVGAGMRRAGRRRGAVTSPRVAHA